MLGGMTQLTRPAIGVMVDPERMAAARKSAMLERIELAHLSQALDLRKIAAEEDVDVGDTTDMVILRKKLTAAGVSMKRPGQRIGVSRDEIAKLETGGRKRPKITTLRKLIETLNYARGLRGKPPLDIEDLQVPGEVLIPAGREPVHDGVLDCEAQEAEALAAYQEVSNEIYYAGKEAEGSGG
jgi:transcriptional regulator with XRE-family HTH domain